MATYDLEEQEQLSAIKAWWESYGNLVTTVVMVAAAAVVGYQGWNWYQRNQSAQASAVYSSLQQAVTTGDTRKAREAAGQLLEKYSGTAYAGMGALLAAKAAVDAGDAKSAQSQLAWVADNARDKALRDLARLRLAAVLLDGKSHDEALRQLEKAPDPAFAPSYADMRGDILAAQGKPGEARSAYQAALGQLETLEKSGIQVSAAFREMLQVKLEATGEGK